MILATQPTATMVAGVLAAFVALMTIIITKEQKVSEFRQAWINAFRDDLAEAISAASTLTIILQEDLPEERGEKYKEWARFTASLSRIELRLNMSEDPHRKIEQCIRRAESVVRAMEFAPENYVPAEWITLQSDVVVASQTLLKIEWDRVKAGEPLYRLTRYALAGIVVCLPLVAFFLYAGGSI